MSFGKILSKYNTFAQGSILRDVGKELIGYLNEQGVGFEELGPEEGLARLTELFVEK